MLVELTKDDILTIQSMLRERRYVLTKSGDYPEKTRDASLSWRLTQALVAIEMDSEK